jgi:hypothetical protein
MEPYVIKAKLIEVLQTVQTLSDEDCPPIDGGTKPVNVLPKFTSKVWPVAAGMLGIALGKSIPCEANIFVNELTKEPLSINQTVALVLKILDPQEAQKAEQALAE